MNLWLIIPAPLFGQQENIAQEDNAAVYYLKAFDLLKYPETKEFADKVKEIINNGWRDEKELEKVLIEKEESIPDSRKEFL